MVAEIVPKPHTHTHTHTQNALNIIPLTPGVTEVKKISHNQFNVNLSGSNRVFNFRALPSAGKSAQQNRNEWCEVRTVHT